MDGSPVPHKYIAYVRKSSEPAERQALSIPAQRDEILEHFPDLDIEFVEESKSAFKPHKRPGFTDMLTRVRRGERRGILAWHPDRLSRNPYDAGVFVQMLTDGLIQDLRFCSYTFVNTPEGIMMLQMALSQSHYSSSKLSVDVKRGNKEKAKRGWLPNMAPEGYVNFFEQKSGFKIIKADSLRYPLLQKAGRLIVQNTHTPRQALQLLNDEWGYRTRRNRPLSRSGFYRFLGNPFYYGHFEYPRNSGIWQKGKHPSMFTHDEWEVIQTVLGRPTRPAPHTRVFAFTGLIRCGSCNYQITAEENVAPQGSWTVV